jgi:hypothetical protein
MKTLSFTLLTAVAINFASLGIAADFTGKWKSEFDAQIGRLKYSYELKQDGSKLTGKAIRELDGEKSEVELKEGRITGDEISFTETVRREDLEITIEYKGKLAGDEIKFTRKVGDFATLEIVAKRETASVDGQWRAEFDTQIGQQKYLFTFKTDGEKLTGKANAEITEQKFETVLTEGKLKGDDISFVEPLKFQDNELRITYSGKVSGDEMKLSRQVGDVATEQLVAKRARATDQPGAKITLKVVKVDSEETSGEDGKGANAVDGSPATHWHTQWESDSPVHPHEIIIELSTPSKIKGITYLTRQDQEVNGSIKDYEFYVSDDGTNFGQPVKKGSFTDTKSKQTATFEAKSARFIKLKALSEVNDQAWTSAAEIGVVLE